MAVGEECGEDGGDQGRGRRRRRIRCIRGHPRAEITESFLNLLDA